MNIYVDIDETICYYKGDRDYNLALPLVDNIKKINKLYDEGHNIKYWTARGTVIKIDWFSDTKPIYFYNCTSSSPIFNIMTFII